MNAPTPPGLSSIALFCGSSPGVEPMWTQEAEDLGRALARAGVRLVYGGGAVGLMGVCARAALAEGGRVLGVIPGFLRLPELALETAELKVVGSMHERKAVMFGEAEAFVVLPGGVGTLEEVIEILSWARLGLHAKPVVFLGSNRFWAPFFDLIDHTVRQGFTPEAFTAAFRAVGRADEVLPALEAMAAAAGEQPAMPLTLA